MTGTAAGPTVGLIPAPGGWVSLSTIVPLGRITAAQWRLLATVADQDGAGELRVTPWRGVVLPGLSSDRADTRLRDVSRAGLVTDPASPWLGIGACTGRPGCAKSVADVRADAMHAVAGITPAGGVSDPLPVYFSGCRRRCGHPGGRWVDVLADESGYRVTVRGQTPAPPRSTGAPDGHRPRVDVHPEAAGSPPIQPADAGPAGRAAPRTVGQWEAAVAAARGTTAT